MISGVRIDIVTVPDIGGKSGVYLVSVLALYLFYLGDVVLFYLK
jgi:hypothetical protein